ncbi:DUF1330 domain-containing protein [Aeromicrobium sp. UC242_57]|uniref:DUF1330 domain-containing protein n=1 Tax=Aeromicrobium sp. UC242_57 TaxID=3374624 RepID=UPI00378D2B1D
MTCEVMAKAVGRSDISAVIEAVHQQFPGFVFCVVGDADSHISRTSRRGPLWSSTCHESHRPSSQSGTLLVHGSEPTAMKGNLPGTVVLIGFPFSDAAHEWYRCAVEQETAALRVEHSRSIVAILNGVSRRRLCGQHHREAEPGEQTSQLTDLS